MDPILLALILVPVLLLLAAGLVVGLRVARSARLDAALARRLVSDVAGRWDWHHESTESDPGVRPEDLARLQEDLDDLRRLLLQQELRLEGLGQRFEALAAEVRTPVEESAPAPLFEPTYAAPSPIEAVRAHAAAEGYESVFVIEDPATPDVFIVEARRGGMPVKGRAHVRPGGRVEADLRPAVRAFP